MILKNQTKISRSKVDLFIQCPRCFFLDINLKIGRPKFPPFTLNTAVDELLKKEFDIHRKEGSKHPLFAKYGIDVIPFAHEKMDEWRHNFTGVRYKHEPTNLLLTGAVDDIWISKGGELHVVDYKATSKDEAVEQLNNTVWHDQYRRQMEFYQWLLRKNGFKVSNVGYFVYVNGKKDKKAFDAKLEFDVVVFPYEGKDDWVEKTLSKIRVCLDSPTPPNASESCEYCGYRTRAGKALQSLILPSKKTLKKISSVKKPKEKVFDSGQIPPSTLF